MVIKKWMLFQFSFHIFKLGKTRNKREGNPSQNLISLCIILNIYLSSLHYNWFTPVKLN